MLNLGTAAAKITLDVSDIARGAKQAGASFDSITAAGAKVDKSLKGLDGMKIGVDTNGAISSLKGLDAAAGKTKVSLNDLQPLGVGLTAIGAGIGGALTIATKGAIDFDSAMGNVNSIAQLSTSQLAALSDQVLTLSTNTGQGPTTLADGLYDIESSGFAGADALTILTAAANAANAGLTDTGTSAAVITAVLNSYGLAADQAGKVSDVLFQTVNDGVVTFGQLSQYMGQTLPIASSLNVPIEQLGASYALMTKNGLPIAETQTDINALLTAAVNPTQALTDAVQAQTGASVEQLVKTKGIPGLLDVLTTASGGSATALTDLLGTQNASAAAMILMKDGGKAYTDELGRMDAASKGVGATQTALNKQQDTTAFKVKKLGAAFDVAKIKLGEKLEPAINSVATGLTGLLGKFSNLPAGVLTAVASIGAVTAGVAGLGGGLILALPKLQEFGGAAKQALSIVPKLSPPLLIAAAAVAGIGLAYKTNFLGFADGVHKAAEVGTYFGRSWAGAYKAFAGHGDSPIVAALKATGVALHSIIPYFPFAQKQLTALSTGFLKAGQVVSKLGPYFKAAFGGDAEKLLKTLPGPLQGVAHGIGTILDSAGDLKRAFDKGGFAGLVKAIPEEFADLGTAARRGMSGIGDLFRDGAKYAGPFGNVLKNIGSEFDDVGNVMEDSARLVQQVFAGDWSGAFNSAKQIVGDFGSLVKDQAKAVVNTFKGLGSAIGPALSSLGSSLLGLFQNTDWAGLGKTILDKIGEALSATGPVIQAALQQAGDFVLNAIQMAWDQISSLNWGDFVPVLEWALYIAGKIADFGGWLLSNVPGIAAFAWKTFITGSVAIGKWLADTAPGVATFAWNGLVQGSVQIGKWLADTAPGVASFAWSGLVQGSVQIAKWLADTAPGVASFAWNGLVQGSVKVGDWLKETAPGVASFAWSGLVQGSIKIADWLRETAPGVASFAWSGLVQGSIQIGDWLRDTAPGVASFAWSGLIQGSIQIGSWLKETAAGVASFNWGGLIQGSVEIGSWLASTAVNVATFAWGGLVQGSIEIGSWLAATAPNVATFAWTGLVQGSVEIGSWLASTATNVAKFDWMGLLGTPIADFGAWLKGFIPKFPDWPTLPSSGDIAGWFEDAILSKLGLGGGSGGGSEKQLPSVVPGGGDPGSPNGGFDNPYRGLKPQTDYTEGGPNNPDPSKLQATPIATPPAGFVSPGTLSSIAALAKGLGDVGTIGDHTSGQLSSLAQQGLAAVTTQSTGATAATGLTQSALDVLGQTKATPTIAQVGAEAVTGAAGITRGALESIPASWFSSITQAGAEAVTGAAGVTEGALRSIPVSWFTSVTQQGAETVRDQANDAASALFSIPDSRFSTVSASVGGVGDVLALADAINAVHSVTVYVNALTNSGLSNFPGLATGGYVTEPISWLAEQGPELIKLPDGSYGYAGSKHLYAVPQGSYVYNANETANMLKTLQGVGAYATGTRSLTGQYDPDIVKFFGYKLGPFGGEILGGWERMTDGYWHNVATDIIQKGIKAEDGTYVNPGFYKPSSSSASAPTSAPTRAASAPPAVYNYYVTQYALKQDDYVEMIEDARAGGDLARNLGPALTQIRQTASTPTVGRR